MENDIERLFKGIKTGSLHGKPALHKPLLLLVALARCDRGEPRMERFVVWDRELKTICAEFYPEALENQNTHYPFGKLENDGIWEIELSQGLKRTSVGHLFRSELIASSIRGGLKREIYDECQKEKKIYHQLASLLLERFFLPEQHEQLRHFLGFSAKSSGGQGTSATATLGCRNYAMNTQQLNNVAETAVQETPHQNLFVAYLNSLHNIGASGANALAESQALNQYFAELYEPFPVVADVIQALRDPTDRVVVLTGHAGDGKSTVALDALKQLRGLPANQPLQKALKEREHIDDARISGRGIDVIKDMSELSSDQRLEWLRLAFSEPGSWLIVSNTGPLLNSLRVFAEEREALDGIESRILKALNLPYVDGELESHTLSVFPKDLVIINMTRLDNVTLGARILGRMVRHPGWEACESCAIREACPLILNRDAVAHNCAATEERVRWVYQRLTAYEQRLTLRQMVAHLAFSLTGGMSCQAAQESVGTSTAEGAERGMVGLESILFSETFFGYRIGQYCPDAGNLRAVELLRRQVFGGPIGADFARQLGRGQGSLWAELPPALNHLSRYWAGLAGESVGVRWRFAQRRMLYLFGQSRVNQSASAQVFLGSFLQSPRLRDYDRWTQESRLSLHIIEQKRLRDACLRVLLEIFSGFSAGQFSAQHSRLYLTLRRPDRAVVQPTQLVMGTLDFDQFELDYDPCRRVPQLVFPQGNLRLDLTLPLLDFIELRHCGELGSELSQIHLAQLEWFGAELLRFASQHANDAEIHILRATIDGQVEMSRYFIDEAAQRLEIYQ